MRNNRFTIKATAQQISLARFIPEFTRWLKRNGEKQSPESINPNENKLSMLGWEERETKAGERIRIKQTWPKGPTELI